MAHIPDNIEKADVKADTQIHDSGSSGQDVCSLREGQVEQPKAWLSRMWHFLHLELTETRGVQRVSPEERQVVSLGQF